MINKELFSLVRDERFQKFFKEKGSDPIDVDKIQLKRDSATLTDKIEPENQPLGG